MNILKWVFRNWVCEHLRWEEVGKTTSYYDEYGNPVEGHGYTKFRCEVCGYFKIESYNSLLEK